MFGDKKKVNTNETTSNQQNRIASGTEIIGDITSEGGFRIDGKIKGNITTKGKVVIGKTGVIEGTLFCANADIQGKFIGNMTIQGVLSLKSSAIVDGEVTVDKLAVEPGATFTGKCMMSASSTQLNNEKKSTK